MELRRYYGDGVFGQTDIGFMLEMVGHRAPSEPSLRYRILSTTTLTAANRLKEAGRGE